MKKNPPPKGEGSSPSYPKYFVMDGRFIVVVIGILSLISIGLGSFVPPTSSSIPPPLVQPPRNWTPQRPQVVLSDIKLMDRERERYYRERLPLCDNPFVNSLASNSDLVWYDEDSMPCMYQFSVVGHSGKTDFHNCKHNLSGDPGERVKGHGKGGNANIEFPWLTGGTDLCDNVTSVKFILLPKYNGKFVPIELHRPGFKPIRGVGGGKGYGWDFPEGSIVGEQILMKAPNGNDYTFELRLRIKQRGEWEVEIFRPYPTALDLINAIKEKRPNWQNDPSLVQAMQQIWYSQPRQQRLADTEHRTLVAFDVTASMDTLPALPEDLVYELMTDVVFRSAKDKTWKGRDCFAPTTDAHWNIVPARYRGTFLGNDKESCAKCHENTFQHAAEFDMGRGWYGYVRGSDQILSFHPIDPSCMINDASSGPVRIRQVFLDSGLVRWRER